MATLQRYDGTSVSFSGADLDSMIAHLTAANAAGCGNGENIFFMAAAPYLLLMDLNWQINRKFSELFQASFDINQLFHLRFDNEQDYYDLPAALVRCGYAGEPPADASGLPSVYMTLYDSGLGGADKAISVGTGDSLVSFGGTMTEPAHIKGLIGGSGVLLGTSDTDITIEALVPQFTTLGSGLPLIDPSSSSQNMYMRSLQGGTGINVTLSAGTLALSTTALMALQASGLGVSLVNNPTTIKSLLGAQGVAITSVSNTVTVGLGPTLLTSAAQAFPSTLSLNAADGTPILTVGATTCDLRLNQILSSANTPVARVLNGTDMVFSGKVTAQTLSVATELTVGGSLVAANMTANGSVFANNFYVSSDYPHPIPSGSIFATVQNAVIANTAELTATSLIANNNRTYITALQTLTTNQGTSLTALQTTQTAQATSITTLQTTQTSQATTLSTLQTQSTANSTAISGLQTTVSTLQTSASTSSGALPYYADDKAARAGGLPRYALYRSSKFSFNMRCTADQQYVYNFSGGGLMYVPVGLGDTNWTIEWWGYLPRLFQLTMVQIASATQSISFGLSGGGAFNVMGSNAGQGL